MFARGMRIGKYEVLERVGAGGMGEVWKARDTTLQRDVAIKVLPDAFAGDAERVARLEREAKLLASLSHPNIAGIHGLDKADGTSFLELELVEGQALNEFLEAGPAPIETALTIALQVAEALEAAHARGVVHRDLKPANVILTPDGSVKVLDFGLAKAVADASGDVLQAVPDAAGVTREGALLGTPAYMSPEQARGKPVDVQTDIWAFGCLLFELLTGWSPFMQASPMETLGKVFEREPDFAALPVETPPLVRRLIRRCLAKEPRDRLHHIADARIEIREALASGAHQTAGAGHEPGRHRAGRWVWTGAAALALIAAASAALIGLRRAPDSSPEPALYAVGPPVPAPIVGSGERIVTLSPDGTHLAYRSGGSGWLQTLGRQDAIPIARGGFSNPFFSPDGESVAFLADGAKLTRVSIFDRVPITIAAARGGRFLGGSWHDETMIFATQAGLYRVSANQEGGEASLVLRAPDDRTVAWPDFLPDGKAVLVTILAGDSVDDASIALLDLETAQLGDPLVRGAVGARYVPGNNKSAGYLVYATEGGRLAARAFDPATGELGAVPAEVPGVQVRVAGIYLSAAFDTSDTGALVYSGPAAPTQNQLVWLDHEGKEETLNATLPGNVVYPRVSPEGDRIAFDAFDTFEAGGGAPSRRIWTMDLERGLPSPLSDRVDSGAPYEDFGPVWTRDGKRIYFTSLRTDTFQVWSHAADGSGTDERLVFNPNVSGPLAWTADNRLVVMSNGYDAADIGLLDPKDPSDVEWLIKTPFSEVTPSLSRDGHWMAYASNETGDRYEIYVQSFPAGEIKKRVSRNGGGYPLWGLDGSGELYYIGVDGSGKAAMMAASMQLSPELKVVDERVLFRNEVFRPFTVPFSLRPYDISPKDGRFLIAESVPGSETAPNTMTIWVDLNWTSAL